MLQPLFETERLSRSASERVHWNGRPGLVVPQTGPGGGSTRGCSELSCVADTRARIVQAVVFCAEHREVVRDDQVDLDEELGLNRLPPLTIHLNPRSTPLLIDDFAELVEDVVGPSEYLAAAELLGKQHST